MSENNSLAYIAIVNIINNSDDLTWKECYILRGYLSVVAERIADEEVKKQELENSKRRSIITCNTKK